MFCYNCLEILYKVFDFGKDSFSFFLFKQFYYIRVIQEFFWDRVNYSLTNLKIYLPKYISKSLCVLFNHDIDIKFRVHLLFDHFSNNCIICLFLSNLLSCYWFLLWIINYMLNFFFFEYSLHKIGPFWPVFKILKFLKFVVLAKLSKRLHIWPIYGWTYLLLEFTSDLIWYNLSNIYTTRARFEQLLLDLSWPCSTGSYTDL